MEQCFILSLSCRTGEYYTLQTVDTEVQHRAHVASIVNRLEGSVVRYEEPKTDLLSG